MSSDLSCPYCNSPAAVPVGARPGQRIPCPRCGESFPYRAAANNPIPVAPPPMPPPPVPTPQRFSNRGIALVVLSVMIVMALLGLLYALKTESIRRSYDLHLPKTKAISIPIEVVFPLGLYVLALIVAWFRGWNRREREGTSAVPQRRFAGMFLLSAAVLLLIEFGIVVMHARSVRPSEDEGPPVPPVPPKALLALGYLPSDTDIIIALHAGELLSEPVGHDLIDHLGSDQLNAHSFETWTGIKLAEMDHAVLGITLDSHLLDHFTLVVRARRPIDQDRVRTVLKPRAGADAPPTDGRTIYPCWMTVNLGLFREKKANLWFADDRTLIVVGASNDRPELRVPMKPEKDLANLGPELRQLIEERFGPSAPFWIAGRMPADNPLWNLLSNPFLPSPLPREEIALLAQVRRFGLWVTVYPTEIGLGGVFDCKSEEAAKSLEAYLAPSNRQGLKAWLTSPEAGPMERALNQFMTRKQHGAWVELQAKASAQAIRGEK